MSTSLPWQRVDPPLWWEPIQDHVIADRHLADGTRQHMVRGHVEAGRVVRNAQIIGLADHPQAEFSDELSHLSQSKSSPMQS